MKSRNEKKTFGFQMWVSWVVNSSHPTEGLINLFTLPLYSAFKRCPFKHISLSRQRNKKMQRKTSEQNNHLSKDIWVKEKQFCIPCLFPLWLQRKQSLCKRKCSKVDLRKKQWNSVSIIRSNAKNNFRQTKVDRLTDWLTNRIFAMSGWL